MKMQKLGKNRNPRLFDLLCMGVRITFPDGRTIMGLPDKEQIQLFCANSPLTPCATHPLERNNLKAALADPKWQGIT